jgi:hypothetical protein
MKEPALRAVDGGKEAQTFEKDANDHYSVLTRLIDSVSSDHAQLRALVYEFARRKLRRSLYQRFEDGDWAAIQEEMRALEAAINKVESRQKAVSFAPEPPLTYRQTGELLGRGSRGQGALVIDDRNSGFLGASGDFGLPSQSSLRGAPDDEVFVAVARFGKRARSSFWWKLQLSFAIVLGVVIYAAIDYRSALGLLGLRSLEPPASAAAANSSDQEGNLSLEGKAKTAAAVRPSTPDIPIPSEYGAYAISQGQLNELTLFPIRVPDERIAISSVITKPSQTHLPAGKLEFVIFKRDLANSAPDRVVVRVVAQVVRALTFGSDGKATTTNIENTWVVRNTSYPMRVAPVPDNPEMIVIRPDRKDLALPAGRYVLALKGIAYDFVVDGPVTDMAHCLERTDALSSLIYTECRS